MLLASNFNILREAIGVLRGEGGSLGDSSKFQRMSEGFLKPGEANKVNED